MYRAQKASILHKFFTPHFFQKYALFTENLSHVHLSNLPKH